MALVSNFHIKNLTSVKITIVPDIRSIMLINVHYEDKPVEVVQSSAVIDLTVVRWKKTNLIDFLQTLDRTLRAYG
jgi:hypothetical protein